MFDIEKAISIIYNSLTSINKSIVLHHDLWCKIVCGGFNDVTILQR